MDKRSGVTMRAVSFILVIVLALTACSGKEASPEITGNTEAGKDKPAATADNLPVNETPVTLKFMYKSNPTGEPIRTDDLVLKTIQEKTNVSYDLIPVDQSNYKDKFNITLASGKIPDVIYNDDVLNCKLYGSQGAFLPLNDLLAKYGQNIVQVLSDLGIYNELKSADGNIYCLPHVADLPKPQLLMVRGDWLKKYNLKVPQTFDDYLNVLRTFKKEDPVGGGKTQPFLAFNYFTMKGFWDYFRTDNTWVVLDGKIEYGPATDNMKQALKFFNTMYQEGLMNKNYLVLAKNQFEANAASGIVGSLNWTMGRMTSNNKLYEKQGMDGYFVPVAPLLAPDGKRYVVDGDKISGVDMLAHDTKYGENFIKAMNWVYSKEGQRTVSYGIEGKTYTMDSSGNPQFMPFVFDKDNPASMGLGLGAGLLPAVQMESAALAKLEIADPAQAEALKMYDPYLVNAFPNLSFNEQEMDLIRNKMTYLSDLSEEYIAKFIMGGLSFDKWNDFLNAMNKAGLQELKTTYNNAYQRQQK